MTVKIDIDLFPTCELRAIPVGQFFNEPLNGICMLIQTEDWQCFSFTKNYTLTLDASTVVTPCDAEIKIKAKLVKDRP